MYNLEKVYVISVMESNAVNIIDFYSNVYITTSDEGIFKLEEGVSK